MRLIGAVTGGKAKHKIKSCLLEKCNCNEVCMAGSEPLAPGGIPAVKGLSPGMQVGGGHSDTPRPAPQLLRQL